MAIGLLMAIWNIMNTSSAMVSTRLAMTWEVREFTNSMNKVGILDEIEIGGVIAN